MKQLLSIAAAMAWICLSEFIRNQIVLIKLWQTHYEKLGLIFPSSALNGVMWGIWSLCFAISISILIRKFSLLQTTLLSWFTGFVLMWISIGNLSVLPPETLWLAVPWSLLECFVAGYIVIKIHKKKRIIYPRR